MYKASSKTMVLTLCGMFTAVVAIGTMAVAIPVPATGGFINLGDGIILTVAFIFGGQYSLIAGALGSALADILLGYAQWAPFSLLIKGLMGFMAVRVFETDKSPFHIKNISAVIIAEIIMILGYYLAGGIMLSSFAAAFGEVPSNMVQAAFAVCVYFVLTSGLYKIMRRKNG